MRLSLPVFELFRVCVVTGFRYVLLTPRSCARLRRFRQTQQVSKQAIRAGNSGGQLAKPRVGRVDVMAATDARIDLAAALRRFARIARCQGRRRMPAYARPPLCAGSPASADPGGGV